MDVIATEHLTKRYGKDRGIEDLDLRVRTGEIFGFLGPNGAGKTTTIRTLLDLQHPTSGSAAIFGLDSRHDTRAIHARLGNLPGDFAWQPHQSGRQMLRYFAALRGLPGLGRAAALAERFQADLDRPLGDLSRGNRQKLGLIQALFHEPELLILDEPTSGLDPLMQEEFLTVLAEERDAGRTVFLSSHDLDEVERICDRVAIIREGRLIAVEEIEAMRAHADRKVTVRFAQPVAHDALASLPGIADLTADGTAAHFRVHGALDPVVKALAAHEVLDLEVARPTLEELFLTYYDRGATAA